MTPTLHLRTDADRKDGLCPIYIYLTIDSKPFKHPTGVRIKPEHWDSAKRTVNQYCPQYLLIHKKLQDELAKVTDIITRMDYQKEPITAQALKERIKGFKPLDFCTFIERELRNNQGHRWTWNTLRAHKCKLLKLREFSPNILLHEVDRNFGKNFTDWLQAQPEIKEPSTIDGYMKFINVFLNEARKQNLTDNPHRMERKEPPAKVKEVLEMHEVQALAKAWEAQRMAQGFLNVTQCFLIQCFTGVRYSDLAKINKTHLLRETAQGWVLEIKKQTKTQLPILLPLPPLAVKLIQTPFRVPTNQVYNRELKDVLHVVLGMDRERAEHFSTHSGRHTFAVRGLNDLGLSYEDLAEFMGHRNPNTTRKYYAKFDLRNKAEKMNRWGKFFQ